MPDDTRGGAPATETIASGTLNWRGAERRTDRYGAICLMDPLRMDEAAIEALAGRRVTIRATVLEARKSRHIGDLFRGIRPTTPTVGEVVDLGAGEFFTERDQWGLTFGLLPDDGRDTDWFDPRKLYRLHDQVVALAFIPGAPQ